MNELERKNSKPQNFPHKDLLSWSPYASVERFPLPVFVKGN